MSSSKSTSTKDFITKDFITKDELANAKYVFIIHDNRMKPFKVVADKKGLQIFKSKLHDLSCGNVKYEDKPFEVITEFEGFWPGKDISICDDSGKPVLIELKENYGNSILIKLKYNKYIVVGNMIQEFSTGDDTIIHYESAIGNNDVPYPVAFSKIFAYFMLDMVVVAKKDFNRKYKIGEGIKMYDELAGTFTAHGWQSNLRSVPMKNVRMIHDRWQPVVNFLFQTN